MKKIILAFVFLLTLTFGVNAQTTIQVNDTAAGYIQQYPIVDNIILIDSTADTSYAYVFDYDSIIRTDSVWDPHGVFLGVDTIYLCTDTLMMVDYIYGRDTTWIDGYYDYRAIAYNGYQFDRWEIITTYNVWYDFDNPDSTGMPTMVDSIYNDTIIQYNIEMDADSTEIDYDGWLDWDMGIPDLSQITVEDIQAIQVTAYFIKDNVGIGNVTRQPCRVYPNPATHTINIGCEVRQVTMYDMNCKVILSTDSSVVDVQCVPNGVYVLRIVTKDGNTYMVKVIKQ